MSDTTVKQLATLVGITTEQLLSQMAGAGIDSLHLMMSLLTMRNRNYLHIFARGKQESPPNQPR